MLKRRRPVDQVDTNLGRQTRQEKRPQVANPAQGKRPSSPAPPPAAAAHQDAAAAAEDPDLVLPAVLPFKRSQAEERYPKGVVRGRHWKHLKQIIQAENYHSLPPGEPTYVSMEGPPSMYPPKKYCDITGFEAPYTDPRTKLRYADAHVFRTVRSLPHEHVQALLSLRNAQIVLK